ncbi:Retrovirus-related Pol polyprotein from transposon RE1 [Vitis vinifera]|uniref:Retrovirus-related Pol polyprotein from transposon RE1 n=1 Tax=Vitis vinifera TaxID=29760 RepID=A0A438FNU5_VITVI|nr:Retrovirus-related Pol polyprotein from transposon RE1 [Vitis vinifera]
MGQGYEDHLVTQEADIPEAYKTCFKFWTQAKGLYTNDIQRLYKVASAIVHLSQQDLDLSTYIGQIASLKEQFLTVMPLTPDVGLNKHNLTSSSWFLLLLASVRILSLFVIRFLAVHQFRPWMMLVPEVEANVLNAPIAINLATLAIVAISYMEDLLALPIMAQSSDSLLPQPPSSSASQTSQASIASVAQPGIGLALPLPSLPLTSVFILLNDRSTGKTIGIGRESQGLYHLTSDSSPAVCISTDAPLLIHNRLGHPSLSKFQKMSPFELVHTDVWGPCRTASTLGFQYFVTFIDDYSRLTMPGNIFQPNLLRLCLIMGFFISLLVLILLNKNGVAERKNRHLVETAHSSSLLSLTNHFISLPPRVLGCTCFVHILTPGQDKLSAKAMKVPLLGIFPDFRRVIVVIPLETHRYFISADLCPLRPLQVYHRRPRVVAPLPFPEAPADSLPIPSASPAPALPSPNDLPIAVRKGAPMEALSHPGWRQAMVDEMAALHSNGTWDLVVYPLVDRLKARLVAKGYTQVYGSDYGDTFSPVAKIASVPLASLHGCYVFLASLSGESGLVCRLRRSLYGLKQSPRAWFSRFSSVVQEFGMLRSTADHSVFYHHNSLGQCIYLVVYVDDIVITGSDQDGIQKTKATSFTHFQTKDLGKLKYFLGIEIAQSSSGVVLSQRKYALDILEETGMLDCKPVDTPMDPNVKLVPGQGEPLGDPGRYRRLVGKLNYLTITRPDISFPAKVYCSENRGHTQVVGYTDADWAGSPTDRRSTSGYCVFIGGNLISWKSKKQDVVARSSAEAEYRAMALATCELIWLRHLLQELRFGKDEQMKLICDNQAALHIASNPVFHERTKHIEVDCHFIREKIASGCVATSFVIQMIN